MDESNKRNYIEYCKILSAKRRRKEDRCLDQDNSINYRIHECIVRRVRVNG